MEVQSERNDNFIKSPYRCLVKGSDSGEGVGIEIPSKSLEAERYGARTGSDLYVWIDAL